MDYFATISPKVFVWRSYRILLFFLKKKVTHVKRAANGGTSLADKSSLPIAKNVH